MPEEVTPTTPPEGEAAPSGQGEAPTTPPAPDANAALNERIAALTEQQGKLIAQLSEKGEPPETAPTPTPQPPSVPISGRIKREDYDALADYASQTRQELERQKLATEFKLDPAELEGEFTSPVDMRRYAQILALQGTVTQLKSQLEAEKETPPEGASGPEAPTVDTGGPSGTQLAGETELAEAYQKARALGQTEAGRRATLQAMYADPERRSLVREV